MVKGSIEFSEFDLLYKTRALIKGQILTNFMTELTSRPNVIQNMDGTEIIVKLYCEISQL